MSTIILNGSPKGNTVRSASYFVAKAFVSKMKKPCEIISIAKTDCNEIIDTISDYDNIIIIMPNYVHAMPGIVMKLFERFPIVKNDTKSIGFVVQAGYTEGIEEEIISRYLEQFAKKHGYKYLGTVIKGEAAGIAIFPDKFKKLAGKFADFGLLYESTGCFDKNYMKDFAKPYQLSKSLKLGINFLHKTGIGNLGWHIMLKKHNAYEKRLDRPYQ